MSSPPSPTDSLQKKKGAIKQYFNFFCMAGVWPLPPFPLYNPQICFNISSSLESELRFVVSVPALRT